MKLEDQMFSLKPYLLEGIHYAIPSNSSPEFRRHISAAIYSYKDDNLNFDNMHTYLDEMDINNFNDTELGGAADVCQDTIVRLIDSVKSELEGIGARQETEGSLSFVAAFNRLNSSFQSAVILLRYGYYMEASPVLRMIFEQICWAYHIIDKSKEVIRRTKVTRTVETIKEVNSNYPSFYGTLSKEAHIDFTIINKYLKITDEGIAVRTRSGEESRKKTLYLAVLAEMYIRTLYHCVNHKFRLDEMLKIQYSEVLRAKLRIARVVIESINNDGSISKKLRYTDRI
jgi:hypothetical protein